MDPAASPRVRWRPPLWFDRLSGIAWRAIAIAIALSMLVAGVVGLSPVVLPLFLGLLFASALRPLAAWLRGRGVRKTIAAALSITLLLLALVLVGWLTVVAVADQWPSIASTIDEGADELIASAVDAGMEQSTADDIADDLRQGIGTITQLLVSGAAHALVPVTAAGVVALSELRAAGYLGHVDE